MSLHRLFVALRPPPAIRTALRATMGGVPGARWQDEDQLHLTLRFLGEVDRHRAEDVAAALGAVHTARFALTLAGVGSFGPAGRPHSLWVGAARAPGLLALRSAVERALARVDIAAEPRAFHPHVTVARLPRSAGPTEPWLAGHAGIAAPPFEVATFALYESHLGSGGASYEAVASYPLAAG